MSVNELGVLGLLGVLSGCTLDVSADPDEARAGEVTQEQRRSALSHREQATVLKLIDDICGDTWCEGDHNFSFDRLDCHAGCAGHEGACELRFRVFSYDTDLETGPTYSRSCQTSGFSGFASLVRTQGSFQQLQPGYYEQLSECISRVEAGLPD